MQIPINFTIVKNPFNWAIVFLMVAFAGYSLALIFHPAEADNGD